MYRKRKSFFQGNPTIKKAYCFARSKPHAAENEFSVTLEFGFYPRAHRL